eukprot:gene8290-biopygen15151
MGNQRCGPHKWRRHLLKRGAAGTARVKWIMYIWGSSAASAAGTGLFKMPATALGIAKGGPLRRKGRTVLRTLAALSRKRCAALSLLPHAASAAPEDVHRPRHVCRVTPRVASPRVGLPEQRQRQRRPHAQAQRRWRRRVHAGGRETRQATTAPSLRAVLSRQRCSADPGSRGPRSTQPPAQSRQTSLSMNGAVSRNFHGNTCWS